MLIGASGCPPRPPPPFFRSRCSIHSSYSSSVRSSLVSRSRAFTRSAIARTVASTGHAENGHVDVSRVYLGMARGNQMLNQYVNVINHDLRAILSWKTRRNMPGFTSYS